MSGDAAAVDDGRPAIVKTPLPVTLAVTSARNTLLLTPQQVSPAVPSSAPVTAEALIVAVVSVPPEIDQ